MNDSKAVHVCDICGEKFTVKTGNNSPHIQLYSHRVKMHKQPVYLSCFENCTFKQDILTGM